MISYTLKCGDGHSFESWFQSAEAFEKLKDSGMLSCAVCGKSDVTKAIMAPNVTPGRSKADPLPDRPLSAPASPAEQVVAEMKRYVEANSENVGKDFAKVARQIHDGDAPERMIHGEAKADEAKALLDDGIAVAPLPWGGKTNG